MGRLTDRDGGQAERAGLCRALVQRLSHQPWAGQAPSVPAGGHGRRRKDLRRTGPGHPPRGGLIQVLRQQREAMGGVAHQVTLNQDVGDDIRLRGFDSVMPQQGGSEGAQVGGGVTAGHSRVRS